jgi:hypothetical protein
MERAVNLAITQHPEAVGRNLADDTGGHQFARTDLGSGVKTREIADIDGRGFPLERSVGKSPLGHASVQGHLSALEPALLAGSGTGPLSLVAASRRLSVPATGATPDALPLVG